MTTYNTGLKTRQRWAGSLAAGTLALTGSALTADIGGTLSDGALALTGSAMTGTFTPGAFWTQTVFFKESGTTVASGTATWGSALTNPSTIVVFIANNGAITNLTVSDGHNTYTRVVAKTVPGTNLTSYIYSAPNTSTSALTLTVSVTPNQQLSFVAVELLQVSNTAGSSASGTSGAGGTPATANLSVTAGGVLFVGYAAISNPTSAPMPTTPDATTTITAGATLPHTPISVASTAGFNGSAWELLGAIDIDHAGTHTTVSYTGVTLTTFTGCTGGSGTISVNDAVATAIPIVHQVPTPTADVAVNVGMVPVSGNYSSITPTWKATVLGVTTALAACFPVDAPVTH